MQVQSINTYFVNKAESNPQFKASYPVVHWVAETNGSYAPALTMELTKKLHRALISLMNGSKNNISELEKSAKNYLMRCDIDYRRNKVVRSFYDNNGGWLKGKFDAISYLLTGRDAVEFDNIFGKAIGVARRDSSAMNGRQSAELMIAKGNYATNGKNYVQGKNRRLYDANGEPYSLHTKFEIKRNKNGKIKGYELVGIKFCPDNGAENPFVKLGYVKE